MGPMGPMMGGWQSWQGGGPAVLDWMAPLVVLMFILAAVTLAVWQGNDTRSARRGSSPAEILRERYARGELSRQQYQQALVDILQDRYVRGEIDLDEFEARLGRLLEEGQVRPLAANRQETHNPR